jgi:uncharacterized protein (DUF488 family)
MPSFDLLSVGHSNIAADRFIAVLRDAGVNAVADVRSTPFSRFCPWFSRKALEARLVQEGMAYLPFGDALGGRPRDPRLFCHGIADYEAMARQDEFQAGLDRLQADAKQASICLRGSICMMCAEREPLDCHRCLLVARALAERGLAVGHILQDGMIEPHTATEQRLLAWDAKAADLFITGQNDRLAAAYRCRARAVAYRAKQSTTGAKTVAEKR